MGKAVNSAAENRVNRCIQDIKRRERKKADSENEIFEEICETQKDMMPILIYLRSEGKDSEKMRKLTSKEKADLNKTAEKKNSNTPYARFDKIIFNSGLLKIVAIMLKGGEPKWQGHGEQYIKYLPSGCVYRLLFEYIYEYIQISKNLEELEKKAELLKKKAELLKKKAELLERILVFLEALYKGVNTYLNSRHYRNDFPKMKDRKAIMTGLDKLITKWHNELVVVQQRLRQEILQEKGEKLGENLKRMQDNTINEGERVKLILDSLEDVSDLWDFKKILNMLSKINADDVLVNSLHDVVSKWPSGVSPRDLYPVEDMERDNKIVELVKSEYKDEILQEKDSKKIEIILGKMVKSADKYAKNAQPFIIYVNGEKKQFYAGNKLTLAQGLDFLERKVFQGCSDDNIYIVLRAKKAKVSLAGIINFNKAGDTFCIPYDEVSYYVTFIPDIKTIRKEAGSSLIAELCSEFDIAVFDDKNKFYKIAQSGKADASVAASRDTSILKDKKVETLEEREKRLLNERGESPADTDIGIPAVDDDDDDGGDTAKTPEELKAEIEEISTGSGLGVWHRSGNLDKVEKSANQKLQNNDAALKTDAYQRGYKWLFWKGKGLEEWEKQYDWDVKNNKITKNRVGLKEAAHNLKTCQNEIKKIEQENKQLNEILDCIYEVRELESKNK